MTPSVLLLVSALLLHQARLSGSLSFPCKQNRQNLNLFAKRGPSVADRDNPSSTSGLVHRSVYDGSNSSLVLIDYILAANPAMKKSTAKKFLMYSSVSVNGEIQSQFNMPLIKGDRVEIRSGRSESTKTAKMRIDIVYEDDDLIVVNKAGKSIYEALSILATLTLHFTPSKHSR